MESLGGVFRGLGDFVFYFFLELSICSQSSDLNFFISAIVLILTNVQQTSTHGLETPL